MGAAEMSKGIVKAKVKVTNLRTAQGKKVYEAVERTAGSYVTIGIQQPDLAYPGGATLGQVAAWMEFGTHEKTPGKDGKAAQIVPERSFIRSTVDRKFAAINRVKDGALREMMAGTLPLHKALERIGYRIVEMMRDTITRRATEGADPLSPATLKKKRALGQPDTPLIATRLLIDHIGYKVEVSEHAQEIGAKGGHE